MPKCEHERVECPKHEGAFDCTPFCDTCEGEQECCPEGCDMIRCDECGDANYLTKYDEDFYLCDICAKEADL